MGNIGGIVLIVVSVLSLILITSCTGGEHWVTSVYGNSGLWKYCVKEICYRNVCTDGRCYSFLGDLLPTWFEACHAFTILASLAILACMILAIVSKFSEKVKASFSSIFAFAAAGFMIIALSIYAGEKGQGDIGWSYPIGWVGVVFAVITGVAGYFIERY